jgi:serine/threonine-protein kinase/endoribonuclease IRE1
MGLGKQLVGHSSYGEGSFQSSLRGQTSIGQSSIIGVGPGSVGWQAPEVMALRMPSDASAKSDASHCVTDSTSDVSPVDVSANARTSRAVDIFSLGCIFYSTLVPGLHPFGEWYERESNIMKSRPNIEPVKSLSFEAHDLINAMLQRSPSSRPTAKQICDHTLFWSADRRLAFLCDFSDRLETDGSCSESSDFVSKLLVVERDASQVVGTSWNAVLHPDLVSNVQRFRSYDPSSVRDLLRLIRNKRHHFDELPLSLKDVIGSKEVGLMEYFEARFPR